MNLAFIALVFILPFFMGNYPMFAPALVALILIFAGKEKLKPIFRFGTIRYNLYGVFIPFLVFGLYLLLVWLSGLANFALPNTDFSGEVLPSSDRVSPILNLIIATFLGIAISFLPSLGEELGWRGYFLRKLSLNNTDILSRSLIVGIVWGLWHLPFYMEANSTIQNFALIKFFPFMFNVVMMSIFYTYLFDKNVSFWPVAIAHSVHNSLFNLLFPDIALNVDYQSIWLGEEGILCGIAYSVLAGIILWCNKVIIKKQPQFSRLEIN